MRGCRGKSQFTAINHSNRAKTSGYRGKKQFTAINHTKKSKKCGIIGVKVILQQSIIQKRAKNAGLSG
jgi:hypothetical protein